MKVLAIADVNGHVYYKPDQPRWEQGNPLGGQWRPEHGKTSPGLEAKLDALRAEGYHTLLFHGTTHAFEIPVAPPGEDFMLDRMLGAHYARDPDLASKFAGDIYGRSGSGQKEGGGGGNVMPFFLKGKGMTVPQPQYQGKGLSGALMSDQTAISGLVVGTVMSKDKALFTTWVQRARNVDAPMAERVWDRLSSGGRVDFLPGSDSPRQGGVAAYVKDYDSGLNMLSGSGKREVVGKFLADMKSQGITHLKYTNTSPTETQGIRNRLSYIVLDPTAVKSSVGEFSLEEATELVRIYSERSDTQILAYADAAGRVYVGWDESKHPRVPSGSEAGGEFAPIAGAQLTAKEKEILGRYQGETYHDVNGYLREGPVGNAPERVQREVIKLDRLIEQKGIVLKEPMVVFRGTEIEDLPIKDGSYVERGYQSTSRNPESADFFGNTTFKLTIPSGAKVLVVGKGKEDEVLLPRGWTLKVKSTSIGGTKRGGKMYEAEVVSTSRPYSQHDSISRPLYVSRHVDNADAIIAWAKSVGFETTLPAEDMHVTVCYSKEPVDWLSLDHDDVTLDLPSEGVRTLAVLDGKEGEWKTIRGRHTFIREGETPSQAIRRSLYGEEDPSPTEKNISVEDRPKTDKELVSVLEKKALGFDLMQSKYWVAERKGEDYKNKMSILVPLAKAHGVDQAVKMYGAARLYTTTHYGRMNNSLRSGKIPKNVDLIDQYVEGAPKASTDVLFRGVGPNIFSKLKAGKTFKDLAFVSTTTDRSVAESFGKKRGKGGVLEISGVKGVAAKIPEQGEGEFLLPRSSSFKVTSVVGNVVKVRLLTGKQYEQEELLSVSDGEEPPTYTDRTLTALGDDGAVVLQFESAPLTARHQYFLDHGASWDYDSYHPHITLTYAAPVGLDLSTIEPYTGRIVLGPEKFTELEEDWAEDIKEHAQVDYTQIKSQLDAMEARGVQELRSVLVNARDRLEVKIKRNAANLAAITKDLTFPGLPDLRDAFRDLLRRAWDAGGVDARWEVKHTVKGYAEWDESKHPRAPAGSESGGEFSGKFDGELFRRLESVSNKSNRSPYEPLSDEEHNSLVKAGLVHDKGKRRGKLTEQGDNVLREQEMFQRRLWAKEDADIAAREHSLPSLYTPEFEQHDYAEPFTPRNALKWLRQKMFWVTDLLAGNVVDEVRGAILSGMKIGEPIGATVERLWTLFEKYIGDPNVLRDGEPLAPSRLETIVRTNNTDAYNQGRLAEIMRPDMVPFITGILYSATLDERTTPVCEFLGRIGELGAIFTPQQLISSGLTPGNHFNCRSLIVPIVVGEEIDEKDFITEAQIAEARGLADARFLAQEELDFYSPDQPRGGKGTQEGGQWISGRASRALETHIPVTRAVHVQAKKHEAMVARLIGGKDLGDNEPFDVVKGKHAVEVKAILSGHKSRNPQITMHPESLARKVKWLRENKATGHTVVIDARGGARKYYYKAGVGSFRLGAMREVTAKVLEGLIR